MNTFKLMFSVCSIVAVTCSGQYTQSDRPWDNQPISNPLVPIKTGTEGSSPADSPPVPTHVNVPASAFPLISQHLCTCTAVPESTATAMLEKYQQLPSSSAVPQQQSAPAQQTYSQQSTQETLVAQTSAQSGSSYSTTVAPSELGPSANQFVRPAYVMNNKVTGY